jgi:hypothetical protein
MKLQRYYVLYSVYTCIIARFFSFFEDIYFFSALMSRNGKEGIGVNHLEDVSRE